MTSKNRLICTLVALLLFSPLFTVPAQAETSSSFSTGGGSVTHGKGGGKKGVKNGVGPRTRLVKISSIGALSRVRCLTNETGLEGGKRDAVTGEMTYDLYELQSSQSGREEDFAFVRFQCGRKKAPRVTAADVRTAVLKFKFSSAAIRIDPNNGTLVTMPLFAGVVWRGSGMAPGDVSKPFKLLGDSVQVRLFGEYNYNFGDGESSGWTGSSGGVYPEGDITHTFTKRGKFTLKVARRISGEYRVNGGEWMNIDSPVTLPTLTKNFRVWEARTRLTVG